MSTLKRIAAGMAALCLCFAMAGCGSKSPEDITEDDLNEILSALDQAGKDDNNTAGGEGVEMVDPFANFTLEPTGVSQKGKISKYMSDSDLEVTYEADKYERLKNGDVVKITAERSINAKKQFALTETEREFTIEGLPEYASKVADIPADILDKMQEQAEEKLAAYGVSWGQGNPIKDQEFLGCYLVTQPPYENQGYFIFEHDGNYLYLVYKVNTILSGVEEGETEDQYKLHDDHYYTYFKYRNVVIEPDGTCDVDLSLCESCGDNVSSRYGSIAWGMWAPYKFKGFSDIEGIYNKEIVRYENADEGYGVDSTVKE